MKNWNFQRYASSANVILEFAESIAVARSKCLAGTGISEATLSTSHGEISAEQELRLIRNLLEQTGNPPGLGFQVGQRYKLTAYGIWGFALISSPTFRSAIEIGLRYLDLSYAFTEIKLVEKPHQAEVYLTAENLPADVEHFLIERDAIATATMQREIYSSLIPVEELSLTIPAPGPEIEAQYKNVMGTVPRFNSDCNRAVFDARFLDVPLPRANQQTMQMSLEQCQSILQQRRQLTGVSGKVRALLLDSPGQFPSMEDSANRLCVTSRTLRRQLATEGKTYRGLVDEVRQDLAEALLQTGHMTIEEIADRLGYAEPANFFHAFKRWKGITPLMYRQTQQSK